MKYELYTALTGQDGGIHVSGNGDLVVEREMDCSQRRFQSAPGLLQEPPLPSPGFNLHDFKFLYV